MQEVFHKQTYYFLTFYKLIYDSVGHFAFKVFNIFIYILNTVIFKQLQIYIRVKTFFSDKIVRYLADKRNTAEPYSRNRIFIHCAFSCSKFCYFFGFFFYFDYR